MNNQMETVEQIHRAFVGVVLPALGWFSLGLLAGVALLFFGGSGRRRLCRARLEKQTARDGRVVEQLTRANLSLLCESGSKVPSEEVCHSSDPFITRPAPGKS